MISYSILLTIGITSLVLHLFCVSIISLRFSKDRFLEMCIYIYIYFFLILLLLFFTNSTFLLLIFIINTFIVVLFSSTYMFQLFYEALYVKEINEIIRLTIFIFGQVFYFFLGNLVGQILIDHSTVIFENT